MPTFDVAVAPSPKKVEQTAELSAVWDDMTLMWCKQETPNLGTL